MRSHYDLANLEATEALAKSVSVVVKSPALIFLEGNLGAGKTAFVRAFLHALGVKGRVKSPTYTLVEPYQIETSKVDYYHFDLYRLESAYDLEAIGVQDYLHDNSICLIEWPEKGEGVLPKPDMLIKLEVRADSRSCVIESSRFDLSFIKNEQVANIS